MCSEDGRDLAFFLYLQLRECGGTPPQQITIFCSEGWKQPRGQTAAQREEIGQQHLQLAQSTFKESCLHFGVTSCILNTLNLEMGIRTQHAPQAVCNVCNHYK